MPDRETKLSTNWTMLFEKFSLLPKIEEDGHVDISANELRSVYEPRLLTKMDHSSNLPTIMRDNGLNILTLSANLWRIGKFEVFRTFPEWQAPDHSVKSLALPTWLESLRSDGLTGEGAVMNAAAASGMLHEFCGDEPISTITGKGRSGEFSFSINVVNGKHNVTVRSAGIEVDAGFETKSGLFLFEAKKHRTSDFNVRQLYYPFRTWEQRVQKPVHTVFLTFANGVFDIAEYEFVDMYDYSSSSLTKHQRFILGGEIPKEKEIVQSARLSLMTAKEALVDHPSSDIPFPQADDFDRITDLVEYLSVEPRTIDEIASEYDFVPRQSDYYFNAARYLGLAETIVGDDGSVLRSGTSRAKEILSSPYHERQLSFAKLLLSIGIIAETYLECVERNAAPSLQKVTQLLANSPYSAGISGATIPRRAQTMLSWITWLLKFDD